MISPTLPSEPSIEFFISGNILNFQELPLPLLLILLFYATVYLFHGCISFGSLRILVRGWFFVFFFLSFLLSAFFQVAFLFVLVPIFYMLETLGDHSFRRGMLSLLEI